MFSALFFFTGKYHGKFLPSPLTNLPRTNQTNKDAGLMSSHEFISFWFYAEVTGQSLEVRTSKQHKIQLNSTNEPGDERKAESQPQVFAGKSKRDRRYKTSWEGDFPWLVHDEEHHEMQNLLFFPEIADKSSSLFIGNGAFRRTTIQAHDKSKTHFKCFEANTAREELRLFPPTSVSPQLKVVSPRPKVSTLEVFFICFRKQ